MTLNELQTLELERTDGLDETNLVISFVSFVVCN